jgi:hypothetical protein
MKRVAALVVALLLIGEQFPFSYFPMYSSFDPRADYYYLATSEGRPVACVPSFGTSTANVKKMYRTRLRALLVPRRAGETEATPAERQIAGEEMIDYLRQLGAARHAAVPAGPVRLMHVEVTRSPQGKILRAETLVAEK